MFACDEDEGEINRITRCLSLFFFVLFLYGMLKVQSVILLLKGQQSVVSAGRLIVPLAQHVQISIKKHGHPVGVGSRFFPDDVKRRASVVPGPEMMNGAHGWLVTVCM